MPYGANDAKRGIVGTILREVRRSTCWYDKEKDVIYLVYNQLRVYIGKLEDGKLRILTEYPYTKSMKKRLNTFVRIENPLEEAV